MSSDALSVSDMITIFDKKTQKLFFQNFYDAVQLNSLERCNIDNPYHPYLLTLMEKAHVKQVPLSFGDHYALNRIRRFWTTDYPILSHIKEDRRQLVMIHLADPDAAKKTVKLDENEEFLSYVEKFPVKSNVSISCILKIEEVIVLRTYEYSKPFE